MIIDKKILEMIIIENIRVVGKIINKIMTMINLIINKRNKIIEIEKNQVGEIKNKTKLIKLMMITKKIINFKLNPDKKKVGVNRKH